MIIRITEKDGFNFLAIAREDLIGEYDVRIESGSTVPSNKLQERNEEMNKYNVLSANPLIQGSPEALMEVTRSLLEKWQDPKLEAIMEALGMQVEEINAQKEQQKAMEEDAMMKQQAMEEAQNIGNAAANRARGMVIDGETPQGMPEPGQMTPDELAKMEGEDVPEEFKEIAASLLMKGKGPMKGGDEVINSAAESIRNM
jgi:hypothetical protein